MGSTLCGLDQNQQLLETQSQYQEVGRFRFSRNVIHPSRSYIDKLVRWRFKIPIDPPDENHPIPIPKPKVAPIPIPKPVGNGIFFGCIQNGTGSGTFWNKQIVYIGGFSDNQAKGYGQCLFKNTAEKLVGEFDQNQFKEGVRITNWGTPQDDELNETLFPRKLADGTLEKPRPIPIQLRD